jgi:hypothetical protein
MTFADPRKLRAQQIAALEADLAAATADDERERIKAQLKELKRFRWSRLLGPFAPRR